jgi:glycosyltransferase involved in cell wall biosynthesis
MPLVSVIVPTFERSDFLRTALRSVLRQTVKDFEVLVVDDGSATAAAPVIKEFDDARFRYFRHESNRGEAAARNTAIRNARGHYLAFLDDDDEWLPQKLRLQLDLFGRCSAAVGCVNGGFAAVRAHDRHVLWQQIPTRRGDLLHELWLENIVGAPSTVMVKRECVERVGLFDENIAFGVDYDLWIRLAERYSFDFVPEIVARYTVHPRQMSSNPFVIVQGRDDLLRKYPSTMVRDHRRDGRFFFEVGRQMSLLGHTVGARCALWKSLRYDPVQVRAYVYLALCLGGPATVAGFRGLLAKIGLNAADQSGRGDMLVGPIGGNAGRDRDCAEEERDGIWQS